MVSFNGIPYRVEHGSEEKSFMIELDGGLTDIDLEVRCADGVVVNAVMEDGLTVFLDQGDVVQLHERLEARAVEIVCQGEFAYRAAVSRVFEVEVLDPTPAVVVEDLSPYDTMQIAIRAEVEKHLQSLVARGVFKDEIDPEELMDDILHGDLEFDEEDEEYTSTSYEDMAEERPVKGSEPQAPLDGPVAPVKSEQPATPASQAHESPSVE